MGLVHHRKNVSDADAEASFIAMMNGITPEIISANNDAAVWLGAGYTPGPAAAGVVASAVGGATPYPMEPFMGLMHTRWANNLSEFLQGSESAEQALAMRRRPIRRPRRNRASSTGRFQAGPSGPALSLASRSEKHRTFFWFILPSALAMFIFIALPLVSVIVQSLFVEHEQVLIQSEVCDRSGAARRRRRWTLRRRRRCARRRRSGGFNGLGTYFDRNHSPRPRSQRRGARARGSAISAAAHEPAVLQALAFTLAYTFVVTPLVLILGWRSRSRVNGLPRLFKGPTIFVSLRR